MTEPTAPGAGPLTRAWIASCAEEERAHSVTDAATTLTPEDQKQIKNGTISAITHSADIAAWFATGLRAVLADAGVLTEGNIHDSAGLFARLDETIYGTVNKVLDEREHRKG